MQQGAQEGLLNNLGQLLSLETISAVGTLLILFFTGLTFWHQVIRTPRSEVSLSVKERSEPYSLGKSNHTFRAPTAQLSNSGKMVALIEDADASATFLDCQSREELDDEALQSEIEVGISRLGRNTKLKSGSTRRDKASISIDDVTKLPPEFQIRVRYEYEIKDNIREYEKSIPTEFKFINEAVAE
ncbi:hypothetical protein [Halospeciosus flavus]|uniref:Uncharacterized protein n=1 Tax=Halospeciosus flavus TaxID=3032283 RepID=A0ABD5Z2Z1_9EURY|nr:hypothetical protein [Halospeciosus flavus]